MSDVASERLAAMRRAYGAATLDRSDLGDDPLVAFGRWFDAASAAGVDEPNAMVLATVDGDARPDARAVLLKGVDAHGFTWFTNYDSDKGRQLEARPHGALVFRWAPFERQVRVRGPVARTAPAVSDVYFATRPLGSQLSAIASPQSRPIPDRSVLEDEVALLVARHGDADLPRPSHWGGFCLCPLAIEFWQGRADRLHDRIRYDRATPDSPWTTQRLAP